MDRKHDIKSGHTQIASSLLEDMAAMEWSGIELRFVLWVWRWSYGFHRKTTDKPIAIREIAREINILPGTLFRVIKGLEAREIIRSKEGVFSFNKYAIKPFPTGNGRFLQETASVSHRKQKRFPQETGAFPTGNGHNYGKIADVKIAGKIGEGRGNAPGRPEDLGKAEGKGSRVGGEFTDAEIFKVGDAYIKAKRLKLADEEARRTLLKRGKVYFAIKDLLTLAAGDSGLVIEAIGDLAEYYGDKDWSLSWIADKDFVEWQRDREAKLNGKK